MLRRVSASAADQALLSLASLVVSVFAARSLTADGFGSFSLALAAYWLSLGVSRGLHSEPLLVRFGGKNAPEVLRAARPAATSVLVTGLIGGVLLVSVAALVNSTDLRWTLVALAACLPGLLIQDFMRFMLFAVNRDRLAITADVVWAAFAVAGVLLLSTTDSGTSWTFAAAWAAGAYLSACLIAWKVRFGPAALHRPGWIRSQRELAVRYAGESLIVNGTSQLALWLIATIAGLAAIAGIRGAIVLIGPITVLYLAVNLIAIPEAVKALNTGQREMWTFARTLAIALGGVCLAWGGLVAWALPESVGIQLLGDTWTDASDVVAPMTVAIAASGVTMAAVVGLRALAAAQTSFSTRVALAPLTLAAAVVGASMGGAKGGAAGLAIANSLAALVWWTRFRRELRGHTVTGEESPLDSADLLGAREELPAMRT